MSKPTQKEVDEIRKLMDEGFGIPTPNEQLLDAARTAMNRFNVNKGKREATERIIMESFKILGDNMERTDYNMRQSCELIERLCDGVRWYNDANPLQSSGADDEILEEADTFLREFKETIE